MNRSKKDTPRRWSGICSSSPMMPGWQRRCGSSIFRPRFYGGLLFALTLLCLDGARSGQGQVTVTGLNGLVEVPFEKLSDHTLGRLGQAALQIRAGEWKHAETTNFIYHFFSSFTATPVAVESEYYYRTIATDLNRDTTQWERKSHIFIFEKPGEWRQFQTNAHLDPWSGGIHQAGELFVQRNPQLKWKGNALGHEIAHLVIYRFFGNGVPLWLNEGYAEYSSMRGYAAYYRARGFTAKPRSSSIAPEQIVPLQTLTTALTYPTDGKAVEIFYDESEKLVHFLNKDDKQKFVGFMDAMSKGNTFETALSKIYAGRFMSASALEREFGVYASRDYRSTIGN